MEFIGDLEDLSLLRAEYERGSAAFVSKIDRMGQRFRGIRRTRGDGNCFYRGFCFAYLEALARSGDAAERARMGALLDQWDKRLEARGIDRIVYEDALDVMRDLVRGEADGAPIGPAEVLARLRDEGSSQMLVMLLRFVTSVEIQDRAEFFAPFILGSSDECLSVEAFCNRSVMVMGEESDHVHVVALSDALGVPLSVLYLDGNPLGGGAGAGAGGEGDDVPTHDFVPEGTPGPPVLSLLYRPGHYDVLYGA